MLREGRVCASRITIVRTPVVGTAVANPSVGTASFSSCEEKFRAGLIIDLNDVVLRGFSGCLDTFSQVVLRGGG